MKGHKHSTVRNVSVRSSTVLCSESCAAADSAASANIRFWYDSARSKLMSVGLLAACGPAPWPSDSAQPVSRGLHQDTCHDQNIVHNGL